MKEKKLQDLIKTMWILKEIIAEKNDNDQAFEYKTKNQMLKEIGELIDLSLEEFYMNRTQSKTTSFH